MTAGTVPLLESAELDELRRALEGFTVDGVQDLLGHEGRAAHARGDLAGVARRVRATKPGRLATLVELFLLGADVDDSAAARALHPLRIDDAGALIERSAGSARARLEIRPYAQSDTDEPWLVVSDFGADVRPGPLAHDHVLGIGSASTTLALATPRDQVGRALDLGTGCGVQALHLSRHAASVTATDVGARALACAATTAALSGVSWDLRRGSWLEPVRGEAYDLVVANPPFVVSSGADTGADTYEYRDSGRAGDALCADLVRTLPGVLAPGGCAQLLANWIIPTDGTPWSERIGDWLDGSGCDAWVWQREVADLGEYATLWLRDAGHVPGDAGWSERYDAWLDWFTAAGVAAVGMGLITLWRPPSAAPRPVVVLEDVPQALEQPVAAHLTGWIERQRWLSRTTDRDLVGATLRAADGVVLTREDLLGTEGWTRASATLRQTRGLCWEVAVDDPIAALVAACDGQAPLGVALAVLASSIGAGVGEVTAAALAVVRDLVARGFLLPSTAVDA